MSTITEVEITPIKPKDGLIGFASVVVDEKLYIGSIGIYRKLGGWDYRITYPTKKVGEKNIHTCHPITKELGLMIETAIITKVSALFE